MHVLIIPSERFVPEDEPGAGIFQYHQAMNIMSAGHRVGVLSIKQSFTVLMIIKALLFRVLGKKVLNKCDEYSIEGLFTLLSNKIYSLREFINSYTRDGIPVVSIDGFYFSMDNDYLKTKNWMKAGRVAFEEYVNVYGKPDVVHAHNVLNAGLLAQQLHVENEVPYIITEHSSDWTRGKIKSSHLINASKKSYLSSEKSFAVSSDFAKKLNTFFRFDKVYVLPNVIDPFLEEKDIRVDNIVGSKFVFLHIGEFRRIKDQETLLRAFSILYKENPALQLRIGGAGMLESKLKTLTKELEIEDGVVFLGYLDREQVYNEMTKCNCFVMSSIYETFCVVLIEAMLFGKPVVACKSGGPIDIVGNEVGKLVEVGSPVSLSDGMQYVLNNIERYTPRSIREYVVQKYGKDRFVNDIEKIYNEAIHA